MKEASSRVKLLLEKSAELLDKANSLKENTTELCEIESVDSELILSLQEKLAEAMVSVLFLNCTNIKNKSINYFFLVCDKRTRPTDSRCFDE